ncbi:MAG: PstS family phosphate ABC transporter substrate-binding protein [Planctomycetota bacterium]|nr:PstS family phosphate ABC transporter substrate-binding protein [Planctomycetota bacterium]
MWRLTHFISVGCLILGGCTVKDAGPDASRNSSAGSAGKLTGRVMIDGSSTVFPISQAVAEEFQKQHSGVKVVVGTSGTGGGFKKFVVGETDINDASRPIKQKEIDACKENGIEYLELKIAIDGLSVIVNPQNDWCECLTVAQLNTIWKPNSEVINWSDVNPKWPQEKIRLYGPDTDSGTFDYFTEAICGEEGASRSDYTPSADDNVLVRGVAGDRYSLGYFGYAYYVENKDKLKIVGVASGTDSTSCVQPTDETIEAGNYVPLSRPLLLYVNKASLKKPEVATYLEYYLEQGQALVSEVGYVRLSQSLVAETRQTLEDALGGSDTMRGE